MCRQSILFTWHCVPQTYKQLRNSKLLLNSFFEFGFLVGFIWLKISESLPNFFDRHLCNGYKWFQTVWGLAGPGFRIPCGFSLFLLKPFFFFLSIGQHQGKKTNPIYPKTECSVPSLKYLTHSNLVLKRCHWTLTCTWIGTPSIQTCSQIWHGLFLNDTRNRFTFLLPS